MTLTIIYIVFVVLVLFLVMLIIINTRRRRRIVQTWDNYNNVVDDSLVHFKGQYHIYKTRDGKVYFVFRYVNIGYSSPRFEIDILSQPSYLFRDDSLITSHRLPSRRPGCNYKICIMPGYEPRTEKQAKKFSADWAELTWNYIKTGRTIDKQLHNR